MKVDKSKWEVKKLGEVCSFSQGIQIDIENQSLDNGRGKVRFIRIIDVTQGNEPPRYIDKPSEQYLIEPHEIAMVRYGNVGFICHGFRGAIANNLFKITPNIKSMFNDNYFRAYLKSKYFQSLIQNKQQGVALKSISFKIVYPLPIIIPPLPEQQAIASELDAIQSLITKYKEQLDDYDNLAKSIFNEMFGDVVSNDKGWESQLFGNLFILKSGDGLSSKQQLGGEYPVYGGNGINGQHCKYNKDGEYIIIGRVGAYCGNVRLVKGRFWLTDNGFELVVKKNNQIKLFLKYLLTSLHLGRYAHKAAQPVISNLVLKNISVPLPPLPLQQTFAARITAIESQKDQVKQQITDLQTLFDSRMQYYFD